MKVEQALEDLIKAGGAGSRGGIVIGKTGSGRPIYEDKNHKGHHGFSKQDHKDAADLHHKKYKSAEHKFKRTLPPTRQPMTHEEFAYYDQRQAAGKPEREAARSKMKLHRESKIHHHKMTRA